MMVARVAGAGVADQVYREQTAILSMLDLSVQFSLGRSAEEEGGGRRSYIDTPPQKFSSTTIL